MLLLLLLLVCAQTNADEEIWYNTTH